MLRRFWKLALTLGVVGAIVSYTVPRMLDRGGEAVRDVVGSEASPLLFKVSPPGEYDGYGVYSPMYLFPSGAPDDVPEDVRVGGVNKYWAWARKAGAVPGQEQTFRLELRGRDSEPVIINGLRVHVVERGPPLEGWFSHERGCGDVILKDARVDLDQDPPTIVLRKTEIEQGQEAERLDLTFQVNSSDVEVVDVLATTRRSDVKWELEVLYSAAGNAGVLVVRDGDKPFEVTALKPGRARFYRNDYHGEQIPFRHIRDREGDPTSEGLSFC